MEIIPDKLFYTIGEVSKIAGVKSYVLRYWESEFKSLSPTKTSGKQRVYRKKDVDTVLLIKKLLHQDGFTISGAKKKMLDEKKTGKQMEFNFREVELTEVLKNIKKQLIDLLLDLKKH
ncbi:MAG: MerR family transcriptional regulator [Candidatus Firestonebacteria bacterium]